MAAERHMTRGQPKRLEMIDDERWMPIDQALELVPGPDPISRWKWIKRRVGRQELRMRYFTPRGVAKPFLPELLDCLETFGPGESLLAIRPNGVKARAFNPGGDFPQGGMLWLDPTKAQKLGVTQRVVQELEVSGTDLERLGCRMLRLSKLAEPAVERAAAVPVIAAPEIAATKKLRPAPDAGVHRIITAMYNHADERGMKPPSARQAADHVLPQLNQEGLTTSKAHIEELAGDQRYKSRRRQVGQRLYGSLRAFEGFAI